MADTKKPLHIAMFPWLAFGHIIPFLDLSKLLVQKGHRISFLSTPRNLHRLPSNLPPSITLVPLPLPQVPGLPEHAEATMDIQGSTQMSLLKKAFDGLEPGLIRFMRDSRPDWIIHDFSPHWLPAAAAAVDRPISLALFSIINAWLFSFFGPPDVLITGSDYRKTVDDLTVPPKWVGFDTPVAYKRYEAEWAIASLQENESGVSDAYRLGTVLKGCDAVLVRHCREFEPDWLVLLEELYGKPVVPLGLMPPALLDNGEIPDLIHNFLDTQRKGSVVYVALGSEVTPSPEQLTELAHGLELSGAPFFWVLRKASNSIEVNLPDEFEERVKGRGMVWRQWAPQLNILSHESVGGFLTHCGWSSIIEGLMFGRPLIALPFLVDQGLNSRIINAKQLGVEISRNENDGSYTRNEVAESVSRVMMESEGKIFKEKANEMSVVFSNTELHGAYIREFVKFLEEGRTN